MPHQTHKPRRTFHRRRPKPAPAFTLTELIIAIALLLIIMLGVNLVFRTTSETITTATIVSGAVRDLKGLHTQLLADFVGPTDGTTGIVEARNHPAMVIRSEFAFAPLNRDSAPGAFRTDILSFFSRGEFKRRTGQQLNNRETYVSDQSPSSEAWVWYGHLKLPNGNIPPNAPNINGYFVNSGPGQGDATVNPNNFYAQDWRLGRVAMLLLDRDPPPPTRFLDFFGNPYAFIARPAEANEGGDLTDLRPLQYGSPAAITDRNGNDRAVDGEIQFHWYDVASATVGEGVAPPSLGAKGYWKVVQGAQEADPNWWQRLATASRPGAVNLNEAYRFYANPFLQKPLTIGSSRQMAMTVPIVLNSCTDFIVEFAGDYEKPDGIDLWTPRGSNNMPQIRWYGLPRDVDGDGVPDVMPVSMALGTAPLPFERGQVPNKLNSNIPYTCVWGPKELGPAPDAGKASGPLLIRITVRVTEKNGRLGDGMTQEYVFKTQ
jgi:prepilin-type N-terminal cleavage/methylation domain-containing protein